MNAPAVVPEIERHLDLLGLEELPDSETLRQHFAGLLKRYHPDRNADRREWAHERTMELIVANRTVQAYIDRRLGRADGGAGFRADSPLDARGAVREESEARDSYVNYQLVEGPSGAFALPVEYIVAILAAG